MEIGFSFWKNKNLNLVNEVEKLKYQRPTSMKYKKISINVKYFSFECCSNLHEKTKTNQLKGNEMNDFPKFLSHEHTIFQFKTHI